MIEKIQIRITESDSRIKGRVILNDSGDSGGVEWLIINPN